MRQKKEDLVELEKNREDLGFGTKVISRKARLLRQDGTFNVKKIGQSLGAKINLYHRLLNTHWTLFIFFVFSFYLILNFIFAIIYYSIGVKNLVGINPSDSLSDFWEAFFFSSQTLTTVGYGHVHPVGYITSFVSAFEALIGLMTFAIITGLLYGRFSKPNPKLIFSKNALISPYLNINGLMVRMVNEKSNQLLNVEASIIYSRNEIEDGIEKRKYYNLDLERNKVRFFPMSWTLVHPITEKSPLYNLTYEDFEKSDTEFIVSIEGTNDTFADMIYVRNSYLYNEIEFGAKFENILDVEEDKYSLDLSKISDYQKVDLNTQND
jgi:inward rectifier potassium channel